jgi:small nuclear ribonucleoprotein (snRNP)-like protein
MTDLVNIVTKHGVTGVLCACLFWMNSRLSEVEERLYECYDEATHMRAVAPTSRMVISKDNLVAILPKELEIKKESDDDHILFV